MPISSALAGGSGSPGGGGSKADILIAITLIAKGLKEAQKVQKALQGTAKATKESGASSKQAASGFQAFGKGLAAVGVAAMATLGSIYAFTKAVDVALAVGQEGAKYRQMTESFKTLNKIVAPNIELLKELGDAALHTTSKFEMMNAASVALAGLTGEFGQQMSEALPQLLRIAKASLVSYSNLLQ